MRTKSLAFLICALVTVAAVRVSVGGDEDAPDREKRAEMSEREQGRIWESLSEEQRSQLREALREVWSDPAVLSAREDVKHASDAYQAAIREAVQRVDPEVAELVVKLQSASEGKSRERLGGGGQSKFVPRRPGDYPMGPPGYLDNLSNEEKARFKKAQEKARESEAVQAAREELESLREEDGDLRRRRLMAHKKMRKAIMESMVEIDPGIEALQEKVYDKDRPSWSGRGGSKGPKSERE